MYVYKELDCVTIVGFGLSLSVSEGKATVEYNDHAADFTEVLREGRIPGRDHDIELDKDQLAWLEGSRTWVKHQLEDGQ